MLGINLKSRWVKFVIWFTAIIFIAIFVFGAHMAFQERKMMVAMTINGEAVYRENFYNIINSRMEELKKESDEDLTDADKLKIYEDVKKEIILEKLIEQTALSEKIFVSNFEIVEGIKAYFFTDDNRNFNQEAFEYYRNAAPAEWWNQREEYVRNIIRQNKLQSNIVKHIKVTEEEILDYYKGMYKKVDLAQVLVTPTYFVSEDDILQYYSDNLDKFVKPEKIKVRHLLIADTNAQAASLDSESYVKINNIKNLISEGYDFEKLILNFSDAPDAYNGGVIDYFSYYDVEENFAAAAFNLQKYEISDIITTTKGFHLIQKLDIADTEYQELESVEEQIKNELTTDTDWQKAEELIEQVLTELSEGKELTELAEKYSHSPSANLGGEVGLVIRIPIDFEYLSKYPDIFEELPIELNRYNDYIFEKAITDVIFKLKIEETSEIIKSKYGFHIFKSLDIIEADMEEYEDKKEEIKNRLLYQKQEQTLQDWQTALLENSRNKIDVMVNFEDVF